MAMRDTAHSPPACISSLATLSRLAAALDMLVLLCVEARPVVTPISPISAGRRHSDDNLLACQTARENALRYGASATTQVQFTRVWKHGGSLISMPGNSPTWDLDRLLLRL